MNLLPLLAIVSLLSCNDNGSTNEKRSDTVRSEAVIKNEPTVVIKATDSVSTEGIISTYLQMKNAFAKDNSTAAATAAASLKKELDNINASGLTGNKAKVFKDLSESMTEHAEHINSNAGKIAHQREHFDMLSDDIYTLIKTFGTSKKLYYDHCPMYNNGKGGDWISDVKEIQNPFYGKAMSTCGTVKEELN